jgi:hypothetical protein
MSLTDEEKELLKNRDPSMLSPSLQKILNIPQIETELLEDTGLFKQVLRGYPENLNAYNGDIATVYFSSGDFLGTAGAHNLPQFINSVIALISRGTKTEVHDQLVYNSSYIIDQLKNNDDWIKLKGNVRNTIITGFNIYPEKDGNSFISNAIFQLQHDVR